MNTRATAIFAALLLALASPWAGGQVKEGSARDVAPSKQRAAAASQAGAAPRASASTISDAIQLVQLGEVGEVEVEDDRVARAAIEAQLKRSTRVKTTVKAVADLGGDGCKRIEIAFVALDIAVQGPAGQKGLWAVVMQWNLCDGGMPPEPQ